MFWASEMRRSISSRRPRSHSETSLTQRQAWQACETCGRAMFEEDFETSSCAATGNKEMPGPSVRQGLTLLTVLLLAGVAGRGRRGRRGRGAWLAGQRGRETVERKRAGCSSYPDIFHTVRGVALHGMHNLVSCYIECVSVGQIGELSERGNRPVRLNRPGAKGSAKHLVQGCGLVTEGPHLWNNTTFCCC